MTRKRITKERNSIATLSQISCVEDNYPSIMKEHVNDITQRINFLLSMSKSSRPPSAIKPGMKSKKEVLK